MKSVYTDWIVDKGFKSSGRRLDQSCYGRRPVCGLRVHAGLPVFGNLSFVNGGQSLRKAHSWICLQGDLSATGSFLLAVRTSEDLKGTEASVKRLPHIWTLSLTIEHSAVQTILCKSNAHETGCCKVQSSTHSTGLQPLPRALCAREVSWDSSRQIADCNKRWF